MGAHLGYLSYSVSPMELEGITGLVVYLTLKFEWGVIALALPQAAGADSARFITGGSRPHVLWRLGGVVISYLADAPFLIFGGGFPKGRLFC